MGERELVVSAIDSIKPRQDSRSRWVRTEKLAEKVKKEYKHYPYHTRYVGRFERETFNVSIPGTPL